MILKATTGDLETVNHLFEEIMDFEERTVKYSVFQKGIYPTAELLRQYIEEGMTFLFINVQKEVCGCVVCDYDEPEEYRGLEWTPGKAMVIHLLAVSPEHYREGYGARLVKYIFQYAKQQDCVSVKLDTGGQNKPAQNLYEHKLGFRVVANKEMNVGGVVVHKEHFFYEHLV